MVGGTTAGPDGFSSLHLRTDKDTLRYLEREDPRLADAWRFERFDGQNAAFYKYGFNGKIGDYMVKALQYPWRFNKIAAGRYQTVLPFKNDSAGQGLQQNKNSDFKRAQYQMSIVCNPGALEIQTFNAMAIHESMPFLVLDYAGAWRFVMDNLGSDESGHAIENIDRNKGKFVSKFKFATKPLRPEWLALYFHKVDTQCITFVETCNPDPGYPDQDYNGAFDECACVAAFEFVAQMGQLESYSIPANTIEVNGAVITHAAITGASLAAFVTALDAAWGTATQPGTWTVLDAGAGTIQLGFAAGETMLESVDLHFALT
jgi:hypothetical protein